MKVCIKLYKPSFVKKERLMKKHRLTYIGSFFSTFGLIVAMILDYFTIGMTLMIIGFLLCIIKPIMYLRSMHKNKRVYKKRLHNSKKL